VTHPSSWAFPRAGIFLKTCLKQLERGKRISKLFTLNKFKKIKNNLRNNKIEMTFLKDEKTKLYFRTFVVFFLVVFCLFFFHFDEGWS
jgi:hypothetical protein